MDLAASNPMFVPCSAGPDDDAPLPAKTHVHSSAELRQLAARWRTDPVGDDAQRAERVARTLEWVADQRERRRAAQFMGLASRLKAWMRRLR